MPDDASQSLKVAAAAGVGIAATIAAIFTLRLLPRQVRIGVVMFGVVLLAGGAAYTYRYFTHPITLSVAAGSLDGEGAKMMSTIASRLGSAGSRIRLKVIDEGNAYNAAKAFSTGAVDMAIVRGDADGLGDARAVVTFAHGVVLIIVPPDSSIDKIEGLRGKTIGVVGGEVNHRVVEALTQEYEALRGGNTRFKDLQRSEIAQALRSKQVSALLIVAPLTEKYLSMIRALFERGGKVKLGLVPIEGAAAIANIAPYFESYELPKGTIRGSPPIPDDDLTTLRVAYYLVANKKVGGDTVASLAQTIMETRRSLVAEFPILGQISAPDTDKDAFLPVHPGAGAYFDGNQQSFFDKYGDQIFYGSMLPGSVTSLLAGAWKFKRIGEKAEPPSAVVSLYRLTDRIRSARSEADLADIEDEIDAILKAEFEKPDNRDADAAQPAELSLVVDRVERLLNRRRVALRAEPSAAA
jgi:TRAP-type uncharacterized transport system substrate-binding protein